MKQHEKMKHEVEEPSLPHEGHLESGMGCGEFKKAADPIAYGQAGGKLWAADEKKIHSQMKEYHWD